MRPAHRKNIMTRKILKTVTMLGFLLFTVLIAAAPVRTAAATISGDEPLAGLSKALSDYYKNKKPDEPDVIKSFLLQVAEARRQKEILIRIVEAEATDGTLEQKMNVASCVLARVGSPDWPNTIEEVVFQKKQFSPITDGRYYSVTITESSREAVEIVQQEGLLHDYTFFCADCASYRTGWFSTLKEFYFDGMHHYFTGEKK